MNLSKKSLIFTFFVCFGMTLTLPIFFPFWRIQFMVPFMIILFYRKPFVTCLWAAAGCGVFLDLLSPHPRLGLHAVAFTIATFILFRQRRNFFADSVSTLPIMTFLFSLLSTLVQWILLPAFDKKITVSPEWVIVDLGVLPAADALFATLIFIVPFFFFGTPIRKGEDYFSG